MNPIKHIITKHLFSTLIILMFFFISIYYFTIKSPASHGPFHPGTELNPNCNPITDSNCFVDSSPLIAGTTGSLTFVGGDGNLSQDNAKLFWDAANKRLKVGLGDNSLIAGEQLTIKTDGSFNFGWVHSDATRSLGSFLGSSGGFDGGWLGTISNHPLSFFTNNSAPQVVLKTNGFFGIGTNNPANKLHLHDSIPESSSPPPIRIQLTNTSTSSLSTDGLVIEQGNSSFGARINQQEPSPLRFATDNTDRLTITDSGNIGLGTTTPNAKLHISGTGGSPVSAVKIDSLPTSAPSGTPAGMLCLDDAGNLWVDNDAPINCS